MKPRFDLFLAAAAALALPGALTAAPAELPAHRVVIVVFDGMRPDFISPATTPNLARLAADGVYFAHHHPVYLSSTEVNGTAIATGMYPAHSTVVANSEFRPRIDPQQPVPLEATATIRKGDEVSGGHYLATPTIAELLQAQGWPTAIAGSKPVALLHDRQPRADGPGVSPVLHEGEAMPPSVGSDLQEALGDFPAIAADQDKVDRDAWTTAALIHTLWKDPLPVYSLLWLAEPDFSQHATGPGSAQSLAVIAHSDADLGRLLAELDHRGLRATTDVLVVSDHGFSTFGTRVDVAAELSRAGFATGRAALGGLAPGHVLVINRGGSSLLYVGGHDPKVVREVAGVLQTKPWAAVLFAREAIEGTFPLSAAHIDSPEAPDLVLALQWTRGPSANGTPGVETCDGAPSGKKSSGHEGLCPYDMHNTLVAAGPDFRRGFMDQTPSGNTDLAPTALWILGLHEAATRMDGRVLSEALTVPGPAETAPETRRLEAKRSWSGGSWSQYLQVSEVNGVRYLDEGSGHAAGAPAP